MIHRPLGLTTKNERLPPKVSVIGLGCSSFSTFFWTDEDWKSNNDNDTNGQEEEAGSSFVLDRKHEIVQGWISTIHYAIIKAGITLLDTAPWYGHGTSERVLGWALSELLSCEKKDCRRRQDLIINTKVGRYEEQLDQQFDFSGDTTIASVQRSLKRLQCSYIDVLQLHDAEFAPNLQLLLDETIPAMMECRKRGWCKALGLTGYPLAVQHQILQATLEKFGGENIWDQALTYGHYNLHDRSLFWPRPSSSSSYNDDTNELRRSFYEDCVEHRGIAVLAAAPLSMGLLTTAGPPAWHPAGPALQQACRRAVEICQSKNVDIVTLALSMALVEPRIPCTILGMKNIDQVQKAVAIVERLERVLGGCNDDQQPQGGDNSGRNDDDGSNDAILSKVLTPQEYQAYQRICDIHEGPFAQLWKPSSSSFVQYGDNGGQGESNKNSHDEATATRYDWDGVQEVRNFWNLLAKDSHDIPQQLLQKKSVAEWQVVKPPTPAPFATSAKPR